MSKLKLNLITGKTNAHSEDPLEVDERSFWAWYVKLLSINSKHTLKSKEQVLLIEVLSANPEECYFRGEGAKYIKDRLDISSSDLSKLKDSLILKGFLSETGRVRGEAFLINSIRSFQRYVKNVISRYGNLELVFNYSYKIQNNEETR